MKEFYSIAELIGANKLVAKIMEKNIVDSGTMRSIVNIFDKMEECGAYYDKEIACK